MMLEGWKRSFSSPCRRRFSSRRLARSRRAVRLAATACATIADTIASSLTFCSSRESSM